MQATMADDEDIAALVIDNGSGMCKGVLRIFVEWRFIHYERHCWMETWQHGRR